MKPKRIWANLVVKDLDRTTEFYTRLGFKFNGASKDLTSFFMGEDDFIIHFFLKEVLQSNIKGETADLKYGNEIVFTLSADSKEEVDDWQEEVKAAGGTIISEAEAFGQGYYGFVFSDLTDKEAGSAKSGIMELVAEKPELIMPEVQKLVLPSHHDVRAEDINLKRLGSVLAVAHDKNLRNFESLLLLEGVGPRTVQSLALVSEIIHGTPSRFNDPARFSFAHGGKDGHPFPVPTRVYDDTIQQLETAIEKSKIGNADRSKAIKNLHLVAKIVEEQFVPDKKLFEKAISKERSESYLYGGRTIYGKARAPKTNGQLSLF